MKKLFVLVAFFLTHVLADTSIAEPVMKISRWKPGLPTAMTSILDVLKYEASYYSFDTDEGKCGGQISRPVLIDHQSRQERNGSYTHDLVVRFTLAKAKRYCAAIVKTECEAEIQIQGQDDIEIAAWNCAE